MDELVGVGGLAVDVKVECAVRIADDSDVKHGNPASLLDLLLVFSTPSSSPLSLYLISLSLLSFTCLMKNRVICSKNCK